MGLVFLVFFVELGVYVRSGPIAIDTWLALWFKSHRTRTQIDIASVITSIATPVLVLFVASVLLLYWNYLFSTWYFENFIPLGLVVMCAAVTTLSKPLFGRIRPGSDLSTLYDFEPSYPSSHAVFIAAAGSSLLFLFAERRILIIIGVLTATLVIGFERVLLGANWITDIFGSFLLVIGIVLIFNSLDLWLTEKERNDL